MDKESYRVCIDAADRVKALQREADAYRAMGGRHKYRRFRYRKYAPKTGSHR